MMMYINNTLHQRRNRIIKSTLSIFRHMTIRLINKKIQHRFCAYNYFVKRAERFIVEMELCASEVLDLLGGKRK